MYKSRNNNSVTNLHNTGTRNRQKTHTHFPLLKLANKLWHFSKRMGNTAENMGLAMRIELTIQPQMIKKFKLF